MTTYNLITSFLAEIDLIITADDNEFSQAAREACIKRALAQYGIDKPDRKTADVTGDGGKYYPLTGGSAIISDWIDQSTRIARIEYPAYAVSTDQTPVFLEPADWVQDFEVSSIKYLFLPNHSPASTETMRITYINPYIFDGSNDVDIPRDDFYAICWLAACYCCRDIATKYSRTSDSIINADSVNHKSRADMFRDRAKEYCALYSEFLNVDAIGEGGDKQPAASDFIDDFFDTRPGFPGTRNFIHHGRDIR